VSDTDLSDTILAKSDQLTADDLLSGPRTVRITEIVAELGAEQPVTIHYDGDNGRPWRPSKSMRRVLVHAWGPDGAQYVGRSVTLYRDPSVTWGGAAVGGIRISAMSHIDRPVTLALAESRKSRKPFTVKPLAVETPPAPRRTLAQFLDALEVELRDCETWDGLMAIVERDDVRKAQDVARGDLATRLGDMLDAARERLAVVVVDKEAGDDAA